ncbi:MAG: F0F1 ATP synthase subunit A [Desulfomonilia bacterium]|jgi:F-type H+-transporting ATPase subunit a
MEILRLNQISPDQIILWQWWFVKINATMIFTWLIMALLLFFSWLATHRLSTDIHITRWQNLLEVIVSTIRDQIKEISQDNPDHYLAFIGTLFLFIGLSNLLAVIPGYVAPTSSLTTTAALAICVFIAVPLYGITKRGLLAYLKEYFQPTFIFFPFHVMGEFTRTLALSIRLFGNIMSHDKVIGILLAVTPLFFPIVMNALGLLIGMVQAYIFAILAMVYIASATQAHEQETLKEKH